MYQQIKTGVLFIALIMLAACGGGGGGGDTSGGGTTPPTTTPPPTPASASKLFIVDTINSAIGSVVEANLTAGTLAFDRTISGANTGLNGTAIRQIIYDNVNDFLYVANGSSILVFNNASTATGNISPTRTITSASITFITDIYLDKTNDVLYVAVATPDRVLAISNASLADGAPAPARTVTVTLNSGSFIINGISVDSSRDILYVLGSGGTPTYSPRLLVYDDASTLTGTPFAADRAIAFSQTVSFGKLFLDEINDRVYASSFTDQIVRVFDNVSTANGAVAPSRSMGFLIGTPDITVDTTNDRLYTSKSAGGGLFMQNNASSSNGTMTPVSVTPPIGSFLRYPAVAP